MSDPDQTANEVAKITQAWREHLAEEAAKHPVTYHDASGGNIVDQMDRYRDLAQHDALAGAIAIGKARGTYVPNEHVNEQKFPPLTVAEYLEMLALGERIARYYRHPSTGRSRPGRPGIRSRLPPGPRPRPPGPPTSSGPRASTASMQTSVWDWMTPGTQRRSRPRASRRRAMTEPRQRPGAQP